MDNLTAHLLRGCPKVSAEERQWVYQQLQQHSRRPERTSNNSIELQHDLSQIEPALATQQQQSALDTLAEVSRHHLDYTFQRRLSDVGQDLSISSLARASTSEQDFIAQLREFNAPPDHSGINEANLPIVDEPQSTAQDSARQENEALTLSSTTIASGLVQTASAANQQLEATQAQSVVPAGYNGFVDPDLHNMGSPVRVQSLFEAVGQAVNENWTPSTKGHNHEPTTDGTIYGFGIPQRPTQKKIRGRFDDSRRKEVAGVRKSGACIRCRMLKKSCSGEVPCRTCRSVESARLWKGTCSRARVADEFTLWSSALFHTLSSSNMSAAAHGLDPVKLPGRMEVRMHSSPDFCMSFAVKAVPEQLAASVERSESHASATGEVTTLLDDGDDMSNKIYAYTKLVADTFVNEVDTPFMRNTLQVALSVARREDAERIAKADEPQEQSPSRTCYNLQEQLIRNVVELWILTTVLAVPEKCPIHMQYRHDTTPSTEAEPVEWTESQAEAGLAQCVSDRSRRLVTGQILAALENRCSRLSKIVMNELERRLLQRQQINRFATFISTVVLLNCVERMTGFYKSLDSDEAPAPQLRAGGNSLVTADVAGKDQYLTNPLRRARLYALTEADSPWPLDTPASALWPQGLRFADLLAMLLRTRALPPKTSHTSEGTLAVMQDFAPPAAGQNRSRSDLDESTKAAAAWLDPMQLSISDLTMKRDGESPTSDELPTAWDLRFISKILLPERID